MRRKILTVLVAGVFLVGMGGMALADLYVSDGSTGSINVGQYDGFLAQDNLANSGDAFELAWINTTLVSLGLITSADYYTTSEFQKTNTDTSSYLSVYSDSTLTSSVAGSYAFELTDQPDYYMIKTGSDKSMDYTNFLFENDINLDYAVFALDTDGYYIKNIGKLSHLDQVGDGGTGGGDTPVPEPATMFLFGAGLVGLAGFRMRKRQK